MTEFSKRIRPMFFNHVSVGLLPSNILLLLDFQPGNGSFTMGGGLFLFTGSTLDKGCDNYCVCGQLVTRESYV